MNEPKAQQQPSPGAQQRPPKKRRLKKSARRLLVLLVAVVFMLSISWVITGIIQNMPSHQAAQEPAPAPGTGIASGSEEPTPTAAPQTPLADMPAVDKTSWNFVGPVQQDAEAMTMVEPDRRMISLPENGRVDMAYFDTSVFVGDSITQGLQIYTSGIPNAKYCAYKGASPKAIYDGSIVTRTDGTQEVPMEALAGYQPDNVYILLGTNAMVAMDDEALLAYYSEMLDVMKATLLPGVNFYIQSITPVLQGVDGRFDMDRIRNLNDQLAKMAWEKGVYFLDLHEALAGDDGWLRSDYGATKDGYHLTPSGYSAWVEYLVTHTAYNQRHAHLYLEGSHYYTQLPPPTPTEEPATEPEEPEAEPAP